MNDLAGVGEARVGEHGLGYHTGERQHGQTAVYDLLELHVRLVWNRQKGGTVRRVDVNLMRNTTNNQWTLQWGKCS